jgi:hypothetical protein
MYAVHYSVRVSFLQSELKGLPSASKFKQFNHAYSTDYVFAPWMVYRPNCTQFKFDRFNARLYMYWSLTLLHKNFVCTYMSVFGNCLVLCFTAALSSFFTAFLVLPRRKFGVYNDAKSKRYHMNQGWLHRLGSWNKFLQSWHIQLFHECFRDLNAASFPRSTKYSYFPN